MRGGVLFMEDDGARQALEGQLVLQHIGGVKPLVRRERVFRGGADFRVVDALRSQRAGGERLHVPQGVFHLPDGHVPKLQRLNTPVLGHVVEKPGYEVE